MLQLDLSWRGLDEEFARIEAELAATARGITVSVWKGILSRTPQWSGSMAASWTYSIGTPRTVDRSQLFKIAWAPGSVAPYKKGSSDAILVANESSHGADSTFKLGDTVYISNGAYSKELGRYAQMIEEGAIPLRGVNMPGTPVATTLEITSVKYGQGVSLAAAGQLKNLKIGF
jgi:hypothetical protein